MTIREGDIESLRSRMREEGKPVKSNTVITEKGDRVHYVEKEGRIRIVGTDKP